jgi:hypothetical protein
VPAGALGMPSVVTETQPAILDRVRAAGGAVFTTGAYNLNLVAVRSGSPQPNRFDDLLYVVYRKNPAGPWTIDTYACTTDPGRYWLQHPGNVDGTAILVPGQYRGAWKLGKHRGVYDALVQRKPVRVWRDADGDAEAEGGGKVYEGLFGINVHRANAQAASVAVEKWSAGCIVVADPGDFARLMMLCRRSAQSYGDAFTLTLLDEGAGS